MAAEATAPGARADILASRSLVPRRIGQLRPQIGETLMSVAAKSQVNGRHAVAAAVFAAIVVGVVTGGQAYLARAGSANAVPFRSAVQIRTLAALAWVLVGIGVVSAARRWPLGRETWKRVLPVHLAGALLAGLTVNLLLHTSVWLLGADGVRAVELPGVLLRDALDHAHLNALVYAALIVGVRWMDGRAVESNRAATASYASRLTARRRHTLTIVAVDDVDWIEGADDYACLHVGARRHLTDDRLHALERMLDPSRFVRVHRSALVNLSRVREVVDGRWGDAIAVLRDGTRVRVSRTRREVLMSALGG
jgi:hypothetical protein